MDLQLSGKLAVVTGATKGIGRAVARQLCMEGACVIVNARNSERVEQTVQELGTFARGIAADLSTLEGVEYFIQEVKKLGSPDILVNNVYIYEPRDFFGIPDSDWFKFFEINVMSGVRLSKAFLPAMLVKNWGRIIFVSSKCGVQIPLEMIHYGVSRTAQLAVARGLAELTKGTEVTVNSILSGPTTTEDGTSFTEELSMADVETSLPEELFPRLNGRPRKEKKRVLFKDAKRASLIMRFASPTEVANLITYVASPLSSATNGAALRVEGGMLKGII